jgi:hypothetical protein
VAFAFAVTLEPERMAAILTLTGIPAGADTFTITRTAPSGNSADVRGASDAAVTGATMILRDYEAPFDLDLDYEVTVWDGATVVATATATFHIDYAPECDAWLVDLAHPTNSLPATIQSLTELTFDQPAGVHQVLERRAPVLTTLPAHTPTGELIVLADTLAERDRMRNLFGSGYPFLLRTDPLQGIGNMYLGLTAFIEERILADGYAPQRRFRVACVQVERPDPAVYVPVAPNTYENVRATWATYGDLLAAVGTYEQLAYTYPADPEAGSTAMPWPPDDV